MTDDCHICHHEASRLLCSACHDCEGCATMERLEETILKQGKFNSNHFMRQAFPNMEPAQRAVVARALDASRSTKKMKQQEADNGL